MTCGCCCSRAARSDRCGAASAAARDIAVVLSPPWRSQMSFKDHFSSVAGAYAAARPEYPDELFDLIAERVPREARVWEPGCGSGQATRGLAARFAHVHATDPSAQQIAQHWAQTG